MSPSPASRALSDSLQKRIRAEGSLSFSTFMEQALYHPEWGYYAKPDRAIGREGDFYTSVSVGPCFGILLARRFHRLWLTLGSPAKFDLLECGAHQAHLASDIMKEAVEIDPGFASAITYHLIEPLESLRQEQAKRLVERLDQVQWYPSWEQVKSIRGIVLSNELPDAFPVDLLIRRDKSWLEKQVALDSTGKFCWTEVPIERPELLSFIDRLGSEFPDGFTAEFCPSLDHWVNQVGRVLEEGLWLTIDYGHIAADLFHSSRCEGTLRAYHKHRQNSDLLRWPGDQDLTADVDFSRLVALGEAAGFTLNGFCTQARYLTGVAHDWLLAMERNPCPDQPSLLRQFQTLTHPAKLGQRFHALEMTRPPLQETSPFVFAPKPSF